MDPSPELLAKKEETITVLCVILTASWAVFLAYYFLTRKRNQKTDRLALIESEFPMGTEFEKSWSSVPASSFTNPSI